jgi:regulator of protease activity HflC (stomatin/prohibitin superfamily)
MTTVIVLFILILAAVACLIVGWQGKKYVKPNRYNQLPIWPLELKWVGVGLIILALLFTFFRSFSIVGPKEAGVPIAWGKADVDSPMKSGWNWKAPWVSVKKISTTRQTDMFNNSKKDDEDNVRYHGDVNVRLGNNNEGYLYVTLQWQPNDDAVGSIFTDFRADDPTQRLYDAFVQPALYESANKAAGTYNPTAKLAEIASSNDPVASISEVNLSPDTDAIGKALLTDLETRVKEASDDEPLVDIISVAVTYVNFDEATNNAIANFQAEVQKTINSQQAIKTAENLAAANEKIAASISKEPGVLISRCLDIIEAGFDPPAAFSCFGPTTAAPVVPVK